jgi:thiol:disulfide interchange protein DsbA
LRTFKLIAAAVGMAATLATASPVAPKSGAEYLTLSAPQTVAASGKKVEVIEFFMYHCPACNALEPALADWLKQQKDNLVFRRIHLPHGGANDAEAHLYLTLDAMGLEGALHDKVMRTWHVERRRLKDDADNLDWAVKNGVDKDKFLSFYNSFAVTTKLRNLARVSANYQVDSTPTLVVDGRYLTNPAMVDAANPGIPRQSLDKATMQVLDALVAGAQKAGAKGGQ